MARSPSIGPNDGAARVNARVVGSKINVKPPADEPIGAVETSRPTRSAMTSPTFDTPLPAAAAFVSRIRTCRGERPASVVEVWAVASPGSRITAAAVTTRHIENGNTMPVKRRGRDDRTGARDFLDLPAPELPDRFDRGCGDETRVLVQPRCAE